LEVVFLLEHLATKANLHWELSGSPLQETELVLEKVLTLGQKALWVDPRWVRWERTQQEKVSLDLMVVLCSLAMTVFWW
jgi:hypothetical protein